MEQDAMEKGDASGGASRGKSRRKETMERLAREYRSRVDQQAYWDEVRETLVKMPPTICFSRKIGVGALDLAEQVGLRLGHRVIDKEIVEYIANDAELNVRSVETYDESYPGGLISFLGGVLGDRKFQLTHYAESLFCAFYFLASGEPSIFVGRGAHLVLPREKVLAVRCISAKPFRVARLARLRSISEPESEKILAQADQEQKEFYRRVYRKTDAPADEFDLIVNFDHLQNTDAMVEAILTLFKGKFGMAAS